MQDTVHECPAAPVALNYKSHCEAPQLVSLKHIVQNTKRFQCVQFVSFSSHRSSQWHFWWLQHSAGFFSALTRSAVTTLGLSPTKDAAPNWKPDKHPGTAAVVAFVHSWLGLTIYMGTRPATIFWTTNALARLPRLVISFLLQLRCSIRAPLIRMTTKLSTTPWAYITSQSLRRASFTLL